MRTTPDAVRAGDQSAGGSLERRVGPVLVTNLVAQVGIVITGGLVRLTGSGLGCPSWPECVPGSYTPVVKQAEGYHKYIEFGNRLLTFVVTAAAVAALVVVVRLARRHGLPRRTMALGAVPFAGVLAQAVLGGVTVRAKLSPQTVAAHFLLSMVLVAASTVLLLAIRAPTPAHHRRELRWLAAAVAAVAAVVLVLGTVVTGAGPHSGDADAPARFAIDPRTASLLHADAVWLFVGLVVALLLGLRLAGAPAVAHRRAGRLLAVTLLQGAIGYLQYFTGLPVPVVALHLLGASLLVVTVTAAVTAVTGVDAGR
jgi:cytochrome c oxidase assembly protein subunit 15